MDTLPPSFPERIFEDPLAPQAPAVPAAPAESVFPPAPLAPPVATTTPSAPAAPAAPPPPTPAVSTTTTLTIPAALAASPPPPPATTTSPAAPTTTLAVPTTTPAVLPTAPAVPLTPAIPANTAVLSIPVQEDFDDTSTAIVGTCLDMCPIKERQRRERLKMISVFERCPQSPKRLVKELAVKEYCRTVSAHLSSSDIRPLTVLESTMCHLIGLLDSTWQESPSATWKSPVALFDFVSDRMRAVRQEMTIQRIAGLPAIQLYAPMAYRMKNFSSFFKLTKRQTFSNPAFSTCISLK